MKKLIPIFLILTLSSCAIHSGLTTNENVHNTTVELSQANYTVVAFVSGKSTVEYFLGIGGIDKPAQIQSARLAMLKNADLIGKPRALINETVEIKRSTFLLWTEIEITVSAHVIEFKSNQSNGSSFTPETHENTLIEKNYTSNTLENNNIKQEKSDTVTKPILKIETKPAENEFEIIQNLIKLGNNSSKYKVSSNKFTNGFYPEENDYVLVSRYGSNDIICKIIEIQCYSKFCPCKVLYYDFENKSLISTNVAIADIKYIVYL